MKLSWPREIETVVLLGGMLKRRGIIPHHESGEGPFGKYTVTRNGVTTCYDDYFDAVMDLANREFSQESEGQGVFSGVEDMTPKQTALAALEHYRGDDLLRAKVSFSDMTPEQMGKQYGESGKTRQEILDECEGYSASVDAAIDWVRRQT